MTARETDFAGNETEQSITFSVNRFGSVYVLDDSLKEIEGTYIKEPIDIVLTETNVDSLSMDTIKITVSANGEPKNLEEGTDYTITSVGGNGSWSQYTYKIDNQFFRETVPTWLRFTQRIMPVISTRILMNPSRQRLDLVWMEQHR